MDPKYQSGTMFLAPGAASSTSAASFPARDRHSPSSFPPPASAFPPVDEHLVQPEISREEIIRGRKIVTMGANPPHAEAHTRADFVILPHVCDDYIASSDLLTRVNEGSNFATDVNIRRKGLDPQTGVRYLEEISFEIVNEQSLREVTEKAEDLVRRGVRRVFAIFIKKGYVGEWSREKNAFVAVESDAVLEDRVLIRPIAIRALIDAALAENEVVLALWKKGNPTLKRIDEKAREDGRNAGRKQGYEDGQKDGRKAGREAGREDGLKAGQREIFVRLLERRFGPLHAQTLSRIQAADSDLLLAWADKILEAASIEEILGSNE
jgi:hypothetical protein